jgi:hypothetical protein
MGSLAHAMELLSFTLPSDLLSVVCLTPPSCATQPLHLIVSCDLSILAVSFLREAIAVGHPFDLFCIDSEAWPIKSFPRAYAHTGKDTAAGNGGFRNAREIFGRHSRICNNNPRR